MAVIVKKQSNDTSPANTHPALFRNPFVGEVGIWEKPTCEGNFSSVGDDSDPLTNLIPLNFF